MAKAGIVYAGTDDGLFILSDPGGTKRWRRIGHELQGQQVTAVYAETPLRIIAYASMGIVLSEDGGQTWQPYTNAPDHPEANLYVVLAGKPTVVISVDPSAHHLVRSLDNGASWHITIADPMHTGSITAIAPSAYHMDTALAGTTNGELLLSDDRGANWHQMSKVGVTIRDIAMVRLI